MTKSELICLIEWAHTQGYPKMEEVSRDYDRLLSHPCSYEQVQSLRAHIAALESEVAALKAVAQKRLEGRSIVSAENKRLSAQLADERRVVGLCVGALENCVPRFLRRDPLLVQVEAALAAAAKLGEKT